MSVLVFALLGVVLGVGAERLVWPPGGAAHPGRRPPVRRVALIASLVVAALIGAGFVWSFMTFRGIERVEVSEALSSGSGTNYLLVGSDNGQDEHDRREGVEGARSDSIMVLRFEEGRARMLSLNRDLWITNPATGQPGRLNGAYNAGPAALIRAVTENFDLPIDRYIEVDFGSFARLVDSIGGVDLYFEHPAIDRASGLVVEESGWVTLDGTQALAFVRSREYTEIIDGQEVRQGGLPDLNRTGRQQAFLREVMAEVSSNRNPLALMSAGGGVSEGLRIDDDMSMAAALRFAWNFSRAEAEPVILPMVPRTTSGGAQVLELGEGAEEVLATFR